MPSSLFPLKVLEIFNALKSTKALEPLIHAAENFSIGVKTDKKIRAALFSPEVHAATESYYKLKLTRVRLAFNQYEQAGAAKDFLNAACLEIYDVDGNFVVSEKLTELDVNVSNAVQVELFQLLLAAKGCKISSL